MDQAQTRTLWARIFERNLNLYTSMRKDRERERARERDREHVGKNQLFAGQAPKQRQHKWRETDKAAREGACRGL